MANVPPQQPGRIGARRSGTVDALATGETVPPLHCQEVPAKMTDPLLVVDMQNGFMNEFTRHLTGRIVTLIESTTYAPILFTRFINVPGSPFHRFVGWHDCTTEPEITLVPELQSFAANELTFTKPGFAGMSDDLEHYLTTNEFERVFLAGVDTDMCVLKIALDIFDLGIEPIVLVDCCASTSGLQSHLAGLAVLARNIGAQQLHDAGLGGGRLAAPITEQVNRTR
jgi:nicotinamidase-related amidase